MLAKFEDRKAELCFKSRCVRLAPWNKPISRRKARSRNAMMTALPDGRRTKAAAVKGAGSPCRAAAKIQKPARSDTPPKNTAKRLYCVEHHSSQFAPASRGVTSCIPILNVKLSVTKKYGRFESCQTPCHTGRRLSNIPTAMDGRSRLQAWFASLSFELSGMRGMQASLLASIVSLPIYDPHYLDIRGDDKGT